jgi:spermidine synthase
VAASVAAGLTRLYPHVEAAQGPGGPGERTDIVLAASLMPLGLVETLPAGYKPVRIAPGRAFTDDRGWVGHR